MTNIGASIREIPPGVTIKPRLRTWVGALGATLLLVAGIGVAVLSARPWVPRTLEAIQDALDAKRFRLSVDGAELLLDRKPDDTRALWILARARAGLGDLPGAVEALRRLPSWSLRKPDALLFEGKALLQLNRGREAERAFLACIERETPGTLAVDARLELFALYAREERFEAFKRIFWDTYPAKLLPADRLAALSMRMRIEFEQTKPELSIAQLKKGVDADAEDAQALAGLAAAVEHAGDLAKAVSLYERALALEPTDVELRERTMGALLRHGQADRARELLAGVPPSASGRPGVLRVRGILAQDDGRFAEAADAFRKLTDLRPDEPESFHRLSQVLLRLGRKEEASAAAHRRKELNEAREALRKAWNPFADKFESDPSHVPPSLIFQLADACEAAGLPREARAFRDEAERFGRDTASSDEA